MPETVHHKQENSSKDQDAFNKQLYGWINTRVELAKVQMIERISSISGRIAQVLLGLIFGMVAMTFVAIALGFLFGDWFESMALGFALVSGIYILLLIWIVWKGGIFVRGHVVDWLVSELMDNSNKEKYANQEL